MYVPSLPPFPPLPSPTDVLLSSYTPCFPPSPLSTSLFPHSSAGDPSSSTPSYLAFSAGNWWRFWAAINDNSGYLGAGVIALFVLTFGTWGVLHWWSKRKERRRGE